MTNQTYRYATLEEMQDMQFGATGVTREVPSIFPGQRDLYELLRNDETSVAGWAYRINNWSGQLEDWTRVTEEDAIALGLWPL